VADRFCFAGLPSDAEQVAGKSLLLVTDLAICHALIAVVDDAAPAEPLRPLLGAAADGASAHEAAAAGEAAATRGQVRAQVRTRTRRC